MITVRSLRKKRRDSASSKVAPLAVAPLVVAPLVVLVYGFAAPRWTMSMLARSLRRRGFRTVLWTYPSITVGIDSLAGQLAEFMQRLDEPPPHLVAHSMGTVVARVAIERFDAQVDRRVFLAPPLIGIPLASFAPNWVRKIAPPLDQLRTSPNSFVNQIPPPDPAGLSIIAGSLDLNVPVRYTLAHPASHHKIILATHNSLLFDPRVAKLVAEMLDG